jgi:hypothetical protein
LVGGFLWSMKKVVDQNASFNENIFVGMTNIVNEMKEYRKQTCSELHDHDVQAKNIMLVVNRIETTLDNRPCVAGTNGSREL